MFVLDNPNTRRWRLSAEADATLVFICLVTPGYGSMKTACHVATMAPALRLRVEELFSTAHSLFARERMETLGSSGISDFWGSGISDFSPGSRIFWAAGVRYLGFCGGGPSGISDFG